MAMDGCLLSTADTEAVPSAEEGWKSANTVRSHWLLQHWIRDFCSFVRLTVRGICADGDAVLFSHDFENSAVLRDFFLSSCIDDGDGITTTTFDCFLLYS